MLLLSCGLSLGLLRKLRMNVGLGLSRLLHVQDLLVVLVRARRGSSLPISAAGAAWGRRC